ncbi:PIN domain-containing protein [Desulfococcaceae bacterium HSG8]|nr:PIN domain-containing protein [Desulfococcaceae bacterium HSG8]
MNDNDKVFIDTNILVYMVNEDSDFHEEISDRFESLAEDYELWISRQVLREYAVVMTRPGVLEIPLTTEELISDIHIFMSFFHIADETETVTNNWEQLVGRYAVSGKRIHDTNIVATMMAFSIAKIFTKNTQDFAVFNEIELL